MATFFTMLSLVTGFLALAVNAKDTDAEWRERQDVKLVRRLPLIVGVLCCIVTLACEYLSLG